MDPGFTGMTLGKYAPLHRGHQFLIELAQAECDHLILLIYDSPQVTHVPLPVRAGWLRELYPAVQVIECWCRPQEVRDTPKIKLAHERYILGQLAGRKVDRFYSSEFYGEHVSAALGAEDWRVDPDRRQMPISGRQIGMVHKPVDRLTTE